MGIGNYRNKVRKLGKIGLNQSLIYVDLSCPTLTPEFYFLFFISVTKKQFYGRKNVGGAVSPPK